MGRGWVAHFIMILWLGSNDDNDGLAQPIWDQAWWAVVGRTLYDLYDLEMFRDCNHPAGNLPRHGKIHSERDDFLLEANHFLSDCPTQKTTGQLPVVQHCATWGTAASTGFSSSTSQRISHHQWLVGLMAFLTFHPLRHGLNSWDLVTGYVWFWCSGMFLFGSQLVN